MELYTADIVFSPEELKDSFRQANEAFKYFLSVTFLITLVSFVHLVYLMVASLCLWKRKDCSTQSFLWLTFAQSFSVISYCFLIIMFPRNQETIVTVLKYFLFCILLSSVLVQNISTLFVREYDLKARLLPLMFGQIGLNMVYKEQKKELLLLADINQHQESQ